MGRLMFTRSRHARDYDAPQESVQLASGEATGEPWQYKELQMHSSRPDLQQEMEREAIVGPLSVQVCGPAQMTFSVTQATKALKMRNFFIDLKLVKASVSLYGTYVAVSIERSCLLSLVFGQSMYSILSLYILRGICSCWIATFYGAASLDIFYMARHFFMERLFFVARPVEM